MELACSRTLFKAGISMDINNASIAITTSNSMRVKALILQFMTTVGSYFPIHLLLFSSLIYFSYRFTLLFTDSLPFRLQLCQDNFPGFF